MSDKCPWCGAEIDHDYESGSREWKCGTIGRFDGKVIVGTDCVRSVVADRDFKAARIAELEAENAAMRNQLSVLGGEWCAENRAAGRGPCGACAWCCKQATDELSRLRSRLGADDDELITHEWMTATYGPKWSIPVENGVIHVFDECPYEFGEDDYEETLAPWFQMAGRHDMVCVRPKIKTRGDVRRLLAALKPADAGGEATQ